jgi:hypothetical protein
MSTATLPAALLALRAGEIDSRSAYVSFGLAYVVGHGAAALSLGPDPLIALPPWLPTTLGARHRRRRRVRGRRPAGGPPDRRMSSTDAMAPSPA